MNYRPTSEANPDLRRRAWRTLQDAKPPAWVPAHCRAVEGLAVAMAQRALARGHAVDVDVIQAGALLHDIGRSVTQDARHASEGARILRDARWPEPIVLVVERHTGAGIDADEAERLGLPVKDYTPQTLEERIVAHADNLHSGDKRIDLATLQQKYRAKGLAAAAEKIRRLHDALQSELDVDLERLAPATLAEP